VVEAHWWLALWDFKFCVVSACDTREQKLSRLTLPVPGRAHHWIVPKVYVVSACDTRERKSAPHCRVLLGGLLVLGYCGVDMEI
jgi:hypothetical protein